MHQIYHSSLPIHRILKASLALNVNASRLFVSLPELEEGVSYLRRNPLS